MENLSRRSFLQKGTLAVGSVGMIAAAPALGKVHRAVAVGTAPAVRMAPAAAHDPGAATETRPAHEAIVAHVRDARSGVIDLYVGKRRVTVTDRRIAAQLARAAR